MRQWLTTPAGRVFATMHGGPAGALAALYAEDATDADAARALQDEQERTGRRRPDFSEAKTLVRRPAPGQLQGSTEDVARQLSRLDPNWRVTVAAEPARPLAGEPWRTD